MKAISEKRVRSIVSFNRITTFIAKLFFMISDFKNGDIVCLTFDKTKRFLVESNIIVEGKIQLAYFNGVEITYCLIEPRYLMIAVKQD